MLVYGNAEGVHGQREFGKPCYRGFECLSSSIAWRVVAEIVQDDISSFLVPKWLSRLKTQLFFQKEVIKQREARSHKTHINIPTNRDHIIQT